MNTICIWVQVYSNVLQLYLAWQLENKSMFSDFIATAAASAPTNEYLQQNKLHIISSIALQPVHKDSTFLKSLTPIHKILLCCACGAIHGKWYLKCTKRALVQQVKPRNVRYMYLPCLACEAQSIEMRIYGIALFSSNRATLAVLYKVYSTHCYWCC